MKPNKGPEQTTQRPNQQRFSIQSDTFANLSAQIQPKCQKVIEPCKNCAQKSLLLVKYEGLAKLLKIKIQKLEKQLQRLYATEQNDLMNQFQDFNMDLDNGSLRTIKNPVKKLPNPFRQLQVDSIIEPIRKQVVFDKTVLKQEIQKNRMIEKKSKKFVSELKILEDEIQNRKDVITRTQKEIMKPQKKNYLSPVPNHKLGTQISFTHLMEKSLISLQSTKNLALNSNSNDSGPSSIRFLNILDKIVKNQESQISLKAESRQNDEIFNQSQQNQQQEIFQKRIIFLSDTILELKTFLLHVRHSIFQFVKMSDGRKLKEKQPQGNYMLGVIINMFEYSEEELQEMFQQKNRQSSRSSFASILLAKIGR